jgi:diadenosine tetraphosphate (Ap4A) HIT family hydrolase
MNTFALHPTLAEDCHALGQWRDLRLLLHKDAHVRWFILVPETDAAEWHELSALLRDQLLTASSALGVMLKNGEGCDKINLAAIGNLVPQFHFHVIGRWRTDPYWPGVVWGRSTPGQAYESGDVRSLQARTLACLQGCGRVS